MNRFKIKRLTSVFLSVCLLASQSIIPIPAYAQGTDMGGRDSSYTAESGTDNPIYGHGEGETGTGADLASESNAGHGHAPNHDAPECDAPNHDAPNLTAQITDWEWMDPAGRLTDGVLALPGVNQYNQADLNTVVSMLPKKISVSVARIATRSSAAKKSELTLHGWSCEEFRQDAEGNWPTEGEYAFYASLPDTGQGYDLSPDAGPLKVRVVLGGGNTLGETGAGDFIVTGGSENIDYSYENNTLTILTDKALRISGTTTVDKIAVKEGVEANITLDNVSINLYGKYGVFPLDITKAAVSLTLQGDNGLYGGGYGDAALQMPYGELTLNGEGTLNIRGNSYNYHGTVGINADHGTITINSGTVTAEASGFSSKTGIDAPNGRIIINGGTITGTGSTEGGAGINGENIIINGGTVTAAGAYYGKGISGGNITINGGNVTASGGNQAAIDGSSGSGVTIKGGTVTATTAYRERASIKGVFSTGSSGNAYIVADAIEDKTNQASWSGVIFEGSNGLVYGNPTIASDTEISDGHILVVGSGKTLTVAGGAKLTNSGVLIITGTLAGDGALQNSGAVTKGASGMITVSQWSGAEVIESENTGAFLIKKDDGGRFTPVSDYTYDSGVLTIKTSDPVTIQMLPGIKSTVDRIVENAVTANITLDGVCVDVSRINGAIAFDTNGEAANLTLMGENELKSGGMGLHVPVGSKLTITQASTGTLDATYAPGIGGKGELVIEGGTVSAKGLGYLKSIDVGTITIWGGTVNADLGIHGDTVNVNGGTVNTSQGLYGDTVSISGGIVMARNAHGGGINGKTITISGGRVEATGDSWATAGIGGGYGESGGTITITGGIVIARGGGYAAAIGNGGGNDPFETDCTVTISGGTVTATTGTGIGDSENGSGSTFLTGDGGNAVIITKDISAKTNQETWSGVIFKRNAGKVYGSPTIFTDAAIPADKTLEIESGRTLVIDTGVTLTNGGSINNDGTITVNGTLVNNGLLINKGKLNGSGKLTGSGQVKNSSNVTVAFSKANAAYGEEITITATARKTGNYLRSAEPGKVDFWLGSMGTGRKLGTVQVSEDGTACGVLPMTKTIWEAGGAGWVMGANAIYADFGGSAGLLESQGLGTLTVNKGDYEVTGVTVDSTTVSYGGTPPAITAITGLDGDPAITYHAVSNTSGLADDTDVASISGSQITLNQAGSFYVKAVIAETNRYNAKTVYSDEITVKPANSSFAVKVKNDGEVSGSFTYGDTITVEVSGIYNQSNGRSELGQGMAYLFAADPGDALDVNQAIASGTVDNGAATLTYDTGVKGLGAGENKILWITYGGSLSLNPSTRTAVISLARKPLTAVVDETDTSAEKVYDGNADFSNVKLILSETEDGDVVTGVADGTADDANAGSDKPFTADRVTLGTPASGAVSDSDSTLGSGWVLSFYSLAPSDVTGTVKITSPSRPSSDFADDSDNGDSNTGLEEPDLPVNGEISVEGQIDLDGGGKIAIPDGSILDAVHGTKSRSAGNGISITVNVNLSQTVNGLSVTLTKAALDKLVAEKVKEVKIESSLISYSLNLAAMKEIQKSVTESLIITAKQLDGKSLSKAAQRLMGSRPAFDLSMMSGAGAITDFSNGSASVWIPYMLAENEIAGNVQAVYVDVEGEAHWLPGSSYDAATKALKFVTGHFSVYGAGYQSDAPRFTDASNHWAKDDIEFVVARGLFTGTSETTFSPDGAMTRGAFVTALGRLAGIDPAQYENVKYADMAPDAYYAPYAVWAVEKGIIRETKDAAFSPDGAISREEIAVIMANYAKAMGYLVPKVREEVTFTDNAHIAGWAKGAVKTMQMAGVLSERDGGLFDPRGTATRAWGAAVIHRYVELVIDPSSFQIKLQRRKRNELTRNDAKKAQYQKIHGGKDI